MLTFGDKILIGVILLTAAVTFRYFFMSPQGQLIEIQTQKKVTTASLSKPQTILAKGPLGTTTIEIKNKKVRIVDSPCSGQTCVRMGWKHKRGQMLVCVPNEIVVRIPGQSKEKVDAITQ